MTADAAQSRARARPDDPRRRRAAPGARRGRRAPRRALAGRAAAGAALLPSARPEARRLDPRIAAGPARLGVGAGDGRRQVALDELRGRPMVLNFWASWCDPCRQEAPVLQRAWAANTAVSCSWASTRTTLAAMRSRSCGASGSPTRACTRRGTRRRSGGASAGSPSPTSLRRMAASSPRPSDSFDPVSCNAGSRLPARADYEHGPDPGRRRPPIPSRRAEAGGVGGGCRRAGHRGVRRQCTARTPGGTSVIGGRGPSRPRQQSPRPRQESPRPAGACGARGRRRGRRAQPRTALARRAARPGAGRTAQPHRQPDPGAGCGDESPGGPRHRVRRGRPRRRAPAYRTPRTTPPSSPGARSCGSHVYGLELCDPDTAASSNLAQVVAPAEPSGLRL